MEFDKDNLPDRLRLQEYKSNGDTIHYGVFMDAGAFDKHDVLFEKFDNEPSGYGWEGVLKIYFEKNKIDLGKRIKYDCNGDEFYAITLNEEDQVELFLTLYKLCNSSSLLSEILALIPKDLKG